MVAHPSEAGSQLAPEWLAHRYDPGHDAIHLIQADRALRRSVPFLIDEHLPSASQPVVARRADVMATAPPAAPIHFIFHSAYCCSTLLANALDREGAATTFKEPRILNDLVGWRQGGATPAQMADMLDAALTLLARPFTAGEAAIVKPSNVVNALAPAILRTRSASSALLLFAPLRTYLGSIAGKGLWGRLWVRDLLTKQLKDGLVDLGFQPEDHFLQTDLQVAAVGWLAQHQLFARLAEQFPGRVRTLESETLLSRPEEALAAIEALFGLASDAGDRKQTVDRVFGRHAKFGGDFNREDRVSDQRSAAEVHGDEIEKVVTWAEAVATHAGVAFALPSPLLAA